MTIATGSQILAADVALGANLKAETVVMFKGVIADIPTGWVICDGNNGTDNMLTRFPKQVDSAVTEAGTTGGATSKTTSGHVHTNPTTGSPNTITTGGFSSGSQAQDNHTHGQGNTGSNTDGITDIRPLFIDVLYIMKS